MYGVVYKVTNKVNGHFYIGQTKTSFAARWSKHCGDARNGAGWVMAAAIRKYGPDSFEHSILEECADKDELNAAEIRYITMLKPQYNAMGGGGQLGSPSAEVRAKISKAGKGQKRSETALANMRLAQKGRTVSPESTAKSQATLAEQREFKKAYAILSGRTIEPKAKHKHVYVSPNAAVFSDVGAVTKGERISVAQKLNHARNPDRLKGENNPMFGKTPSDALRARYAVEFVGEGNPFFGKQHTEETRAKMRAAHAARPPVTCPHCGKTGQLNTMKRWHFDRCRSIP